MGFRFGAIDAVIENRTQFLAKNNLSYIDYIPMQSDHGDIIKIVDRNALTKEVSSQEEAAKADVLITQDKNLALLLTTADCQPVSFYDPETKTKALAHISRHTLAQNLAKKTVNFLCEDLHAHPADLLIHIGPHIKKESYEFPLPLKEVSPHLEPFIEEKDGYAYIDTVEACLWQLTCAGVSKENIDISDVDTATSKNHFSYYVATRDALPDGRLATVLAMSD